MFRSLSLVSLVVLGSAVSLQASAVDLPRSDFQGAIGVCRNAVPTEVTGMRYRPLGLANETSSQQFISCALQGDDSQNSRRGATRVAITLSNYGTSTGTVSCTLVNGFRTGSGTTATYTVKTLELAAGAGGTIQWVPSDVASGLTLIKTPAISCTLPAGFTLHTTVKDYSEDVGA